MFSKQASKLVANLMASAIPLMRCMYYDFENNRVLSRRLKLSVLVSDHADHCSVSSRQLARTGNSKCSTPIRAETVSRHNEAMTPDGTKMSSIGMQYNPSTTGEPCDEGTYAPSTRAWTSLVPVRRANEVRHVWELPLTAIELSRINNTWRYRTILHCPCCVNNVPCVSL